MDILTVFKGGPQNIRNRLLRDIVFLVITIIAVLLILGIYFGRNIRKQASAAIITENGIIVKKRFSSFIDPVQTYLEIGYQWGKNGLLSELDDQEMGQLFIPMLATHENISAISIADINGNDFFLKNEAGKWLTRRSSGENAERTGHWQLWINAGHLLKSWEEKIDFDPRQRPWFSKAKKNKPGVINWTEPYRFFTSDSQGITASISWYDGDDKKLSVMAFDLLQNDLLSFLDIVDIGDQSHILLIARDGSIVAHNKNRLDSRPVVRAMDIWQSRKKQNINALEFTVDHQTWWAGFTPLNTEGPSAWIAIIIPENKIMENVQKQWLRVAMTGAVVLVVGIIFALMLVRKYSYQLRDLPRQKMIESNFSDELLALIAAGESAGLEFKSTVRMNLKSGKNGKEIEVAWLKTVAAFMNSDGGILLIGVEDDGNIMGIGADNFENEDKCRLHCKNLLNNHIGPEFSRFIHLKIRHIQEKTIVVIECERVRKPVFLSMGKNEDFYVRSGPSSLKLTMSQMVKYLDERQ
jgi:hypothetical protein